MFVLSTTPPILTTQACRRLTLIVSTDSNVDRYAVPTRCYQGAFVGGGVVGAGAAGFSVVDGAGAGAGAACFSGATGVDGAAGFFSVVVGAGAFFGAVGCFLAQPANVNATKTRTASAVRTTFLMVNPFRKTISLNTPPEFQRAKTWIHL